MHRLFLLVLIALGTASGCAGERSPSRARFAFITNGVADFWTHAEAGAQAAAKEFGVDVTVIMPNSMTDQTRKIEDLLIRGTDGIAVSPIDPANQVEILNKAARESILITHDSDAPQTNRRLYIGMDNYEAGLMCGRALREAMPDGGEVMILIGRLDQHNSKRRRQGCIDGLLGRQPDDTRNDPPGAKITSDDGRFTVLGTMTDQFDRAKAKANAEDAITRHPNLAAMVGLFEYNPPLIMEALARTGKLGEVKVMGFDENLVTLQGIAEGTVVATVVQSPYRYGYESIRALYELKQGNDSVIPDNQFINIPARVIDASNVEEFTREISARLANK